MGFEQIPRTSARRGGSAASKRSYGEGAANGGREPVLFLARCLFVMEHVPDPKAAMQAGTPATASSLPEPVVAA